MNLKRIPLKKGSNNQKKVLIQINSKFFFFPLLFNDEKTRLFEQINEKRKLIYLFLKAIENEIVIDDIKARIKKCKTWIIGVSNLLEKLKKLDFNQEKLRLFKQIEHKRQLIFSQLTLIGPD
ncbi:unnamed protein product [marine sediment metagenome]|uniref:Uncharacterized protein n=1 Tax=marine sediment metagenome TaxID=412755 RepID=X0Y284_9ZZZZ